jgi:hypothetical protein
MDLSPGIPALERLGGIERITTDAKKPARSFQQIVDGRKSKEASAPAAGSSCGFVQMCREIENRSQLLDHIIEAARGGKKFSPQELLALQAEVYRFVEGAALVSKAAEQTASGLHRLWQLQI